METCSEHGGVCQKLGNIDGTLGGMKSLLEEAVKSIKNHVLEADREGGVRDRVATLEKRMKWMPWWCFAAAVFGSISADAVPGLSKLFSLIIKAFIAKLGGI